jgi:hypothetical protein
LEQAVLTPVFASIPASEKRNIPSTKGAGRETSFREAQHLFQKILKISKIYIHLFIIKIQ